MPRPNTYKLKTLQLESKLRHMKRYEAEISQLVRDVLFFDGSSIEEIKMMFTKNGDLRKFETVTRELMLMKKVDLKNKEDKYSEKIGKGRREMLEEKKKAAPETPLVIKRDKNIIRNTFMRSDPPQKIQRPPAVYNNRSREEIINQYLEA